MKKQLFTLALSLMFGSLYAQTDLKTVFAAISAEYDKDPMAFVQKMDNNLRFTGAEGQFFDKQKTLELAATGKGGKVETKVSDLRIKQSGTLGLASGVRFQTLSFPNGVVMSWKDAFTYTFEWKNNAWVMTDIHHTKIDYQIGDEVAIRQAIDAENKAYHEANFAVWGSNWATVPYIERQQESLKKLANTPYLKGQNLQKAYEAYAKIHKPTGLTSVVSDYESHLGGNVAWVAFTQEDRKADGSVAQKERALRILEKINGQWKIVMMSSASF